MSKNKKCRVCGNNLYEEPLLSYENMPKAAQYLPDKNALKSDKGVDLEVCQCSGCGLVQLSNDPVPYYKEVIRAAGISEEMMAFRKKQFTDLVEKYSLKGKKVIEIGCGRGEYLSIMARTGVKAYGLEQGKDAVRQCLSQGLNVSRRIKDGPFDAFYILSFLEHLPKPSRTLREIGDNLTDHAIGLVEVPNFDMIIRKKLFAEFIGDHLLYFTRDTLATTLRSNGFNIIECNEVWHDYIISAVVRKRGRLDLSCFSDQQTKLKTEIDGYISRFKDKRVAIWGAGHQALALISLLELEDKIKYVVDSATFKQGKYTPATHLPIVSPAMLDSDPVDAVIVMAASYSDEVARIIQQKYGAKIKVAIFKGANLCRN